MAGTRVKQTVVMMMANNDMAMPMSMVYAASFYTLPAKFLDSATCY